MTEKQNFTIVKRGYDISEVDRHVAQLNLELREYREKDSAISSAILNAQIAADEIKQKANTAAETITSNARAMAEQINRKAATHMTAVIGEIRTHHALLGELREEYNTLLSKYFKAQDAGEIIQAQANAKDLENFLQNFIDKELGITNIIQNQEPEQA